MKAAKTASGEKPPPTKKQEKQRRKKLVCRGPPGCAKPVKGCRGVGVTPDIDEI